MDDLADWGPEDVCVEIEYCDGASVNGNGSWRRKGGGRRVERVEQVGMDEIERERVREREREGGRRGGRGGREFVHLWEDCSSTRRE